MPRTETTAPQHTSAPGSASLALLVLRVVAGGIFLAHGAQKVFEYTLAGTATAFADMGVPMAGLVGPSVAVIELVGGTLLVVGIFSRVAALLLLGDMLGAILFVHAPAGLWVDAGGVEFVALLAATAATILIAGPGRYSLAHAVLPSRKRAVLA